MTAVYCLKSEVRLLFWSEQDSFQWDDSFNKCIYFSKGNSICTVSFIQLMEVLTVRNWPCLSCVYGLVHIFVCVCLYISTSPQTDKCATAAFSPTQTWLLIRWEMPNLPGNGRSVQGREKSYFYFRIFYWRPEILLFAAFSLGMDNCPRTAP